MSEVRIELSYEGIGQMLRSAEMASFLQNIGASKAAVCGDGYNSRVHDTGKRQAVNVYAETKSARKDNLNNNTLLKVGCTRI